MALSYKQPPKFDEKSSYETWKNEIEIWRRVTDVKKEKQALAITLSLSGKARETALEIPADDLDKEAGVTLLIEKLDAVFLKEAKDLAYEAYTHFDIYRKSEECKMADYIYEYEIRYGKCKKHDMTLPDAILAFKLLDNANLSSKDKRLAMTACSELTFASMKSALKRIFGDRTTVPSDSEAINIKQESAYFTKQKAYSPYKQTYNSPYKQTYKQSYSSRNTEPPGTNPINKFGKRSKCVVCKSVFHWVKECPHKPVESVQQTSEVEPTGSATGVSVETVNITLFTKESQLDHEIFVVESLGAAIIDTACTKTVCGEKWLNNYVEKMDKSLEGNYTTSKSNRKFRFGDGNVVLSDRKVTIPAKIGSKICKIETEVVKADIPLLLSKDSLKRADTVLNLKTDKATMFGKPVDLEFTSSGHYCVRIMDQKNNDSS